MPIFDHDGVEIAYDQAGEGFPVLLLHGFPQTRAMWRPLVPHLAERFTVVTADLRGYGASGKPEPGEGSRNYGFDALAGDMLALMTSLAHERFHLVGHDRGARTAYRMALEAPGRVESLTLMDILPTDWLLDHWEIGIATAYYHWTFLAQPAPFVEEMIGRDPDHFFESCLLGWGSATLEQFAALDEYRRAWRDPATISGMVHNYRAALTEHRDGVAWQVLDMPTLVLWGREGIMERHYDVDRIWAERFSDLTAKSMPGGHFFIDQNPEDTLKELTSFLR